MEVKNEKKQEVGVYHIDSDSYFGISQIKDKGMQGYLNIYGSYSTLWHESIVANHTDAEIVSDIEGDGNPDVLVHTGL